MVRGLILHAPCEIQCDKHSWSASSVGFPGVFANAEIPGASASSVGFPGVFARKSYGSAARARNLARNLRVCVVCWLYDDFSNPMRPTFMKMHQLNSKIR